MQDSDFEQSLRFNAALHYADTPQSARIYNDLLPRWARLFAQKQRQYRKVRPLGARGTFPTLNRKMGILEDRIWEGNSQGDSEESTERVIMDLIGDLFIMWCLLEYHEDPDTTSGEAPDWHEEIVRQAGQDAWRQSRICPDPTLHQIPTDGGWAYLPKEVQEGLRRIAKGQPITHEIREGVHEFLVDENTGKYR
jgi:hypothetical protein